MEHLKSQSPGTGNKIDRRRFTKLVARTAATYAIAPAFILNHKQPLTIKALAFDAFTLFDTRSVSATAEALFPGKSHELMATWRNRQFEYTWLRSLSNKYKDFRKVTEDALIYACNTMKVELSAEKKDRLMQALLEMKFVEEAGAVMSRLRGMRLQLAILSNATKKMLDAGIYNSGLQSAFDFVISTDTIRNYKPHPAAYQLAIDAFKVKKEEVLYVAFGGWDAAGAKLFGYPTVWINASGLPVEQLDAEPDFICRNLAEVADYASTLTR